MEENKESKQLNKNGKVVIQYDLLGGYLREYPSTMEAYRQTGISNSGIADCARGRIKTAGGYKWKYKENIN